MKDLAILIDKLEKADGGSHNLDVEIVRYKSGGKITGLELQPQHTTSVSDAMRLLPKNAWWRISHLEAAVCPCAPDNGLPWNNAVFYEKSGRPVEFRVYTGHDGRERTALALATAALQAEWAAEAKITPGITTTARMLFDDAAPHIPGRRWDFLTIDLRYHWFRQAVLAGE